MKSTLEVRIVAILSIITSTCIVLSVQYQLSYQYDLLLLDHYEYMEKTEVTSVFRKEERRIFVVNFCTLIGNCITCLVSFLLFFASTNDLTLNIKRKSWLVPYIFWQFSNFIICLYRLVASFLLLSPYWCKDYCQLNVIYTLQLIICLYFIMDYYRNLSKKDLFIYENLINFKETPKKVIIPKKSDVEII